MEEREGTDLRSRAKWSEEHTVILISGLSGSGKTTAIKALEDIGFIASITFPFFFYLNLSNSSSNPAERSPRWQWWRYPGAASYPLSGAAPGQAPNLTGTGQMETAGDMDFLGIRGKSSRLEERRLRD